MNQTPNAWQSESVLVVIVNYRTPELVAASLASLAEERRRCALRVTVADNASPDDSLPRIRGAIEAGGWSGWVQLLALPRNGGFAYANNAAIRQALESPRPPRYVHLLNPDTEVRPGAVELLARFLEEHPRVGIAGSRLEDPDGHPQASAFRFPSVLGELEWGLRLGPVSRLLASRVVARPPSERAQAADWVSGASMMLRREVFDAIGLLDEGYFLYFEELDFCLTARRAGWPCWHVPASRVVHHEARATGLLHGNATARLPAYWFESRRRFFLKNHPRWKALAADLALLGGFGAWRIRRVLQRKPDLDTPHFLADLWRHSTLRRGWRLASTEHPDGR